MKNTKEPCNIYKIAFLVSLSCVLQISESLLPHPVPGLRLGLANVITLISLVNLGFGYALEITILRTLLSSFVMGTFMSPGFILSFSGGLISTLIMGLIYGLRRFAHLRVSIIGISIIGALTHSLVQLYLAYLILVKHPGIFVFLPWLCIGAVVMGWVTGVVSGDVCRNLKGEKRQAIDKVIRQDYVSPSMHHYLPGNSFLHKLPVQIKLISIFMLSLAVLVFNNLWIFLWLFLFLFAITEVSQTSFAFLILRAKRYSSLVFTSFLFPVFFNSGKHVVSNIGYFRLTSDGLHTGMLFAARIIFLIMLSSLLTRTASPQELAKGLARVLSPLRTLGICDKRIADILALSWNAIPLFWEIAGNSIRALDLKKTRNPRNLIPILSGFITKVYLEAEQATTTREDAYFPKSL